KERLSKMRAEIAARYREQYPNGKLPPWVGVCQQCGQEFRAKYKGRKYCSIKCYRSSPDLMERLRVQSSKLALEAREAQGFHSAERLTKKCLQCGTEMYVRPKEFNTKRYCSKPCYRAYMADRFDRWIANPQGIALPQGYDEFLSQEELPCL